MCVCVCGGGGAVAASSLILMQIEITSICSVCLDSSNLSVKHYSKHQSTDSTGGSIVSYSRLGK